MSRAPGAAITKACLACGRTVFSVLRGAVTIVHPARGERVEANGDVVATCRCGRRVVWLRGKRSARATVSAG